MAPKYSNLAFEHGKRDANSSLLGLQNLFTVSLLLGPNLSPHPLLLALIVIFLNY